MPHPWLSGSDHVARAGTAMPRDDGLTIEKGLDDAGNPRRRSYHSQDRASHLEHAITTIFFTLVQDLCQGGHASEREEWYAKPSPKAEVTTFAARATSGLSLTRAGP